MTRSFVPCTKSIQLELKPSATQASGAAQAVRGRLRVNVDSNFSRLLLSNRLGGFLEAHPLILLELITRDQISDLVAEGNNIAVRFGDLPFSSLIALKLLELRVMTLAAPSYLRRLGLPTWRGELVDHFCIEHREPAAGCPYE
jgi:DNA-binding transcriptional LysR family regulator